MASDPVKAFGQVSVQIDKSIAGFLGRSNVEKILKEAKVIVRRRTLLGFGVPRNGGSRERLKPLSQSYKDQRSGRIIFFRDKQGRVRAVPANGNFRSRLKLSPKTTVSKSNLTLTGQLLDSLQARITGPGKGEIRPTGVRDDGLTNEEVANFVQEAGRVFLNLSNNEIKQLEIFSSELFRKILIKKLT